GFSDQRIVVNVQNIGAIQRLPVLHQTQILPVVVPDIHEIQGVAHALVQVQEIDGQAVVERVARRVHNLGIGKQPLDQTDIEVILGAFVGDISPPGKHGAKSLSILSG